MGREANYELCIVHYALINSILQSQPSTCRRNR